VARSLAAFTVVDCGFSLELDEEISHDTSAPRRNGATIEALERAHSAIVVGGADPVSLARLIRAVHELKMVVPSVSPLVVVNRVRPSLGWSDADIVSTVERASGVAAIRLLPDDPAACDRSLVHGRSVAECAPDGKLSRALSVLATEITGVQAPVGRTGRVWRRRR
jgi:Flp pilus assembly CpaE family ATPase